MRFGQELAEPAEPCETTGSVPESSYIWNRRLILVTGKGGVGKTTVAAALARAAQRSGRRVLLAEVTSEAGTRSPLFELFGRPKDVGETPVRIDDDLDGVRITPSGGHKLFLRAALRVGMLVDAAMRSAALRRFLSAAPAFPEIGTLYQLVTLLRSRKWDHLILDLPATGHALGLVSLPRTVLKVVPKNGLIGKAIREGLDVLTDSAQCGAVLVSLPERLPVTETVELAHGLAEQKVQVRAMLLNQQPHDPFNDSEREALQLYLTEREDPRPLLGAREFRRLLRALEARTEFADRVPAGVAHVEIPRANVTDPRAVVSHVESVITRYALSTQDLMAGGPQ